jgi:dTMP kinase
MDYVELNEELQRVLEDLIEKTRTVPVIVEGEWDRRALRSLGIDGDIRVLNRGNRILALAESIASNHREAVILTDWDVRGGRLARSLREALEACGVRHDDALRARLTMLCRKDIKDVESLHSFAERVAEMAASRNQQRPSKRYYADRVARRDTRRRSRD